jgi:hypothetical protein
MGKILKKLASWFRTKEKIIEEYARLLGRVEKLERLREERLAKLDQNETYALIVEDMTEKNAKEVTEIWEQAGKRLKWTPPKLLIIDKKLYGVICRGTAQTAKRTPEKNVKIVALSEEAGEHEGGLPEEREC